MSGGLEPADLGLAKTFAEGNTEVPPSLLPIFPVSLSSIALSQQPPFRRGMRQSHRKRNRDSLFHHATSNLCMSTQRSMNLQHLRRTLSPPLRGWLQTRRRACVSVWR